MPRPTLYLAITNHGFGHAVRAASIAAEVQRLNPDILLILTTTAPRWLLESYIEGEFIYRPRAFDIGVVQPDSLTMDYGATLAKLREIRQRARSLIATEADFLRTNAVNLVLGDIPPLTAPIARAAGVPVWLVGNFGWDFIYRDYGGEFLEFADWIGDCFSQCDRLLRLPLHEPMSGFPNMTDMGLTGGNPRHAVAELRSQWQLTAPRDHTVLLSFGGLGLQQIPYENLANFPDWQFISFDAHAPQLPNLRIVTDRRLRPVDFMPLCDRIVSKPGYSTFAEALRLDLPIVSLTREGFAESPILLEGLQNYSAHQIITPETFFAVSPQAWDFLRVPPLSPRRSATLDRNGTEAIAREIVAALS